MKVLKRDGREVEFDKNLIENAVYNAALSSNWKPDTALGLGDKIAERVHESLVGQDTTTVEDIQDLVEHKLMCSKAKDVAKEYITYRAERSLLRESKHPINKAVEGIITQTDEDLLKENANLDGKTLTTQRTLITGELMKHLGKQVLPEDVVKAHEESLVHYHDSNFSPVQPYTNCCLIDIKGMLENGFTLGGAKIGTPKSIIVATAVCAQVVAQASSNQYGGTSLANLDQVLAPYAEMTYNKHLKIAEEEQVPDLDGYAKRRTKKDIYDAFQALEYELNSLFNSHSQSPFTTVSFGMGTSWFEREIQKAILNVRLAGLGDGSDDYTAIFPKLIFFIEEGLNLNKDDPNYDIKRLALKCSARRQYPDIISAKNNRDITGSSVPVTSMGCRSFLSVWKDENGKEVLDGRNNLGVNSISIPLVALKSNKDMVRFWEILENACEIAHKGLQARIKSFEVVTADVAPIMYQDGAFGVRMGDNERISELFKNGRSSLSLGYIGLHEAACYMFDIDKVFGNEDAYQFTLDVAKYFKAKTEQWKKEEGYGYSLYSSPSEGYAYRACMKAREQFGIVPNVTDKEYFTNSYHLDVREKVTPFEKIEFEAPFHWIANAGHISYCELQDMKGNLDALETVWDYAVEKLDYFGTNVGIDKCHECGCVGDFTAEDNGKYTCPECGNTDQTLLEVCKRVSGYLSNVTQRPVNKGKQFEFNRRVKHG